MTADDSRLRVLTALARKMSHTESARRDAASCERFEERLAERGANRWWLGFTPGRLAWSGALLALCVGVWLARGTARFDVWSLHGPALPLAQAPLRYTVQGASASASAPATDTEQVQSLAFSDGSHMVLAPHARAQVAELSAHGARVRLARGHAEVSIARRAHAAWRFQAGPYTVKVTGTAFKLSWSDELQQVEVGMHHGSVIVTGPQAPQGLVLRAGQRLVACDRTHRLVVEDWTPPAAQALASVESKSATGLDVARKAQPDVEQSNLDAELAARGRGRKGHNRPAAREAAPSEHAWAKKVARGDFDGVLRDAKQLGYARVLEGANALDLTALADAARYAGKTALGRDALLSLRARFPEAEMARSSAFFLGRLSQGQAALAWYDRYLREQPEGTYVSQALGRSMMLRYEQGDTARAAQLATRYLARFPAGPYAASAHKLSEAARVNPPAP